MTKRHATTFEFPASYHQHLQQAGASSRLAGGLRSPEDFNPAAAAYNPATPSNPRRGAMTQPSPSSHWSGPFPPPPPPPPPFPPPLSSLTSRSSRAKSSSSSPSPPAAAAAASAIAGKDYFASPFPPPPAPPQHISASRFGGIVSDRCAYQVHNYSFAVYYHLCISALQFFQAPFKSRPVAAADALRREWERLSVNRPSATTAPARNLYKPKEVSDKSTPEFVFRVPICQGSLKY